MIQTIGCVAVDAETFKQMKLAVLESGPSDRVFEIDGRTVLDTRGLVFFIYSGTPIQVDPAKLGEEILKRPR